ncbi:MAG: ABC transporter ATP-binding protein [Phycisphaerales bacterium]|nr:ABC transporter ATP-binding protein [Phycisphaerales bacterium]
MGEPLLELRNLVVHYGAIQALHEVSLKVHQGRVVALLGANGAGKSTTLRTISGLLTPTRGEVIYQGKNLRGQAAEEIARAGIAHVPEGRGIFANLSVEENLELGAYLRGSRRHWQQDFDHAMEMFPRLRERLKQNAGTLSGGEQQMLAIARAVIAKPRLMLLDEPSLGLAPQLVALIFEMVRTISRLGTTILLVEQNAHMALSVADEGYVMEVGRITMHDSAQKLEENPMVREAYLGRN